MRNTRKKRTAATRSTAGILLYAADTDGPWKRIRDKYASEHPLCEQCLKEGRYVKTEEIHHKLPLSQGGTHEWSNLIALCRSCHAKIHAENGDRWHNR